MPVPHSPCKAGPSTPRVASESVNRDVAAALDRWTEDGLISAEQAGAIRAADATGAVITARNRVLITEVLGSVGAIAASAAAVVGTAVLWPNLTSAPRSLIPGLGTALLLGAGSAVPRGGDRSTWRLGALLWLLAAGALAATVAIFSTDVLALAGQNVALLTGAAPLVLSAGLLTRFPSPHLMLAAIGAATCMTVGVVLQYDSAGAGHVGAALVCLGAATVLLGWSDLLPERTAAVLAGAVVALVGAEMLGDVARHWPIVAGGLLGLGLLALFIESRDRACLVTGLVAAVITVVQGIVQLTRGDRADGGTNRWVVLAVFTVGAVVLAASLAAIRSATRVSSDTAVSG